MEPSPSGAISSSTLSGKRSTFRAIGNPYESFQEKRRRAALQRQKAARLQSASRARTLALDPDNQENLTEDNHPLTEDDPNISREETVGLSAMEASTSYGLLEAVTTGRERSGSCGQRGRASGLGRRSQQQQQHVQSPGTGGVRAYGQRYGNELMQPEWMTDVPSDLAGNWLVMPRPEGMRCLLVTSRGRTVSWLRNGAPLHRFHSPLPGGSPATYAGCGRSAAAVATAGDYCLLDCIFHPPNNTYYVQDLLCWRGYALYDTAAEFRSFWLTNKFQEEGLVPPPGVPELAGATAAAPSEGLATTMAGCSGVEAQPVEGGCEAAQRAADDADTEMAGDAADGEAGPAGARAAQHQHRQQAPVSFRIVPLSVRPCTLQGLRAAYGRVPPPPAAGSVATDGSAPWATTLGDAGGVFEPAGPRGDVDAALNSDAARAQGEASLDLEVDFIRDGLYFLHRQGHYCPGPGTTPLALLWKDLGCSRYLLDTDSKGQPLELQTVVLSYRADRTVATEDEPPVVLGRLPEAFVAAMGPKLKPGRLLKFSIRQGGINFHEGRPVGADLHYEGPANQRRGRADSFSKILFQRLARTAPITAAMLAAAAAAAPSPEAAAAAAGPHVALGCARGAEAAASKGFLAAGDIGNAATAGDMAIE